MGYRKGYYKKDGTYVQGHYVNSRSKKLYNKKDKGGCLSAILIVMFFVFISCTEDSKCSSKTCSDFANQSEAQSVFDSDRDCYENLDADNDNIACENLSN
ncbi:excalibur calcium-binding domain-containing protein [uncultured Winogradskyella sp.]|uniref:excalibur calcium-binding domain-containing protein n=1 Tax=uncultured Winogradskyella sp. TaxID=395353 RepID=UPI00261A36AC|nr:excalibur calcium-binding domain-containing protein [uncultured Winogradskyella sp.]